MNNTPTNCPYRLMTDGVDFKIQQRVQVGFLWWKWEAWEDMRFPWLLMSFPFDMPINDKIKAQFTKLVERHRNTHEWREVREES